MVVVSAIRSPPPAYRPSRHTPFHQPKWWHHQKEAINKSNLCSFIGGAPALWGEPSALRLNQYKCCALQPRNRIFRAPTPSAIVVWVSYGAVMGFNKLTHLSEKPSGLINHAAVTGRANFNPLQQSIKTSMRELRRGNWRKRGGKVLGCWSKKNPVECGAQ